MTPNWRKAQVHTRLKQETVSCHWTVGTRADGLHRAFDRVGSGLPG